MKVKYSAITPNFRVGDVVKDSANKQYEITDAESGEATLRVLEPDERNKEVQGTVYL